MNDRHQKWKIFAVQLLIKKTRRAMARRTVLVECTPQDYVEAYDVLEGIAASDKAGKELGIPLSNEEALARLEDKGFELINIEHGEDVIGVANGAVAMFNDAVATAEMGTTLLAADKQREQNLIGIDGRAVAVAVKFLFLNSEEGSPSINFDSLLNSKFKNRWGFKLHLRSCLADAIRKGLLKYNPAFAATLDDISVDEQVVAAVNLAELIHNTYEGIE